MSYLIGNIKPSDLITNVCKICPGIQICLKRKKFKKKKKFTIIHEYIQPLHDQGVSILLPILCLLACDQSFLLDVCHATLPKKQIMFTTLAVRGGGGKSLSDKSYITWSSIRNATTKINGCLKTLL